MPHACPPRASWRHLAPALALLAAVCAVPVSASAIATLHPTETARHASVGTQARAGSWATAMQALLKSHRAVVIATSEGAPPLVLLRTAWSTPPERSSAPVRVSSIAVVRPDRHPLSMRPVQEPLGSVLDASAGSLSLVLGGAPLGECRIDPRGSDCTTIDEAAAHRLSLVASSRHSVVAELQRRPGWGHALLLRVTHDRE